jgi:putative endonuclease
LVWIIPTPKLTSCGRRRAASSGCAGPWRRPKDLACRPRRHVRHGAPRAPLGSPMHSYHVYILASIGKTLYIGVTNDLSHRVQQHKTGMIPGFTSKYKVNRLVYFETFADVYLARAREKQLKGWVRRRKIALIEADNPEWEDLADQIGVPLSVTATTGG